MALTTRSLARASARHPWRVISIWAVLLVVSGVLMGALLSGVLTTDQSLNNSPESKKGFDLLEQRLRGPQKDNEAVLVTSQDLTVDDAAFRAHVEGLWAELSSLGPDVIARGTNFYQSGDPSLVSNDRHSTLIPITMAGDMDTAAKNIEKVIAIVEDSNARGTFETFVSGNASIGYEFQKVAEKDLSSAERLGIPIALLILVLVFGAVAAAVLPVVVALVSIALALGVTALVGQQFQFSFFVTNMISMMGLAVGIDYSLFIVSRFREERARGLDKVAAVTAAGGTAGRAVFFSGVTVVLALTGMLIIPTSIFRSLAGGAIFVVLAAVAASLTLLPAVLSIMGDKVNALTIPVIGRMQKMFDEEHPGGFWDVVSRTVMRYPVISVVAATALLVAAAVPYFDINISTAGVSTLPDSFQSKQGFLKLEQAFAGGQVYPAEVVIDGDVSSPAVTSAVERVKTLAARNPLFGPSTFEANQAGDFGVLSISLAADPNAKESMDAVKQLRRDVHNAFDGTPARVYVTGFTAVNVDFFKLTDDFTPIVFAFVLGLSFLLLTLVFRSIVVPAKAILMNLLSVGAAYGLIVLVSQKGFAKDILGFQQVEGIEPWLPLFLFSVLFGLSMDYHVFLLSRIRERYDQIGDNTEAVAFGVRSTGRLITGAAMIMVVVFAGFASGQLIMFQQFGFGLAAAVLIDATIIRSVLVPASMRLLGKLNWYLPPLLQWLPHVGIEGEHAAVDGQAWQRQPEPTAGG